jgi:hypothetical protein
MQLLRPRWEDSKAVVYSGEGDAFLGAGIRYRDQMRGVQCVDEVRCDGIFGLLRIELAVADRSYISLDPVSKPKLRDPGPRLSIEVNDWQAGRRCPLSRLTPIG